MRSLRSRRPAVFEAILASISFALAAAFLLRPILRDPTSRVYGLPSDPLAEVWRLAQFRSGELGLIGNSVSTMANAPSGVSLRRATEASQILYDGPAWLLAQAAGPVLTYNLLLFVGLWTAGLATYAAARAVQLGMAGSAVAGGLFMLSPPYLLEARLHVSLTWVWMLPVLLALGIRALTRPGRLRGLLYGAALGLCGYVTGYLLLEALALSAGMAAAGLVCVATRRVRARELAVTGAWAALAALAVLTPLLLVFLLYRSSIAGSAAASLSEVTTYSLRPREFVDRSGAYLGLVALALAVAGLWLGRSRRTVCVALALVGLAGATFSLRPDLSLLGLDLPMPSEVIHSVVPYWRVFGRNAIVVALAVSCLAGLLIDRLTARRNLGTYVLAFVLAVGAGADIVRRPPPPAADFDRPDAISDALRGTSGSVAEYPLYGFDHHLLGPYLLRQLRHGRPLLNGSIAGTSSGALALAASAPNGSQAYPTLWLAGVRDIVIHPPADAPKDARFGPGLRVGRALVYSLEPPRRPIAAAGVSHAGVVTTAADGSPLHWIGGRARVHVRSRPGSRRVTVGFEAVSNLGLRRLRLGDVTTAPIGAEAKRIAVCVRTDSHGSAEVSLSPARGDEGASIGVFHLEALPDCRVPQ